MIAAKKFNKRGIAANKFLYIDELKNFWLILELYTFDKTHYFLFTFNVCYAERTYREKFGN